MALTAKQVQELYLGYYGRPADPVGLAYWQTQTLEAAMAGFAASAEFTNQYAGMTVEQQVNQVYVNLLGRPSDLAGLLYWSGEIVSGRETIGTLVMSMQRDALGRDVTTLQMRADFAEAFTNALDTTDEVLDYSGQTAAAAAREAMADIVAASTGDTSTLTTALANLDSTVAGVVAGGGMAGQTYMLTTGIDTGASFTGGSGNDTFNAADSAIAGSNTVGKTFTSLDSLDGGAGTDTLNIAQTAAMPAVSGVTVKNIEVVNLTSGADIGATAGADFDVSGWTGLTTANVKQAEAVFLKAAVTTDVTVAGATKDVTTTGGKNVTVTQSMDTATDKITINKAAGDVTVTATDSAAVAGGIAIGVGAGNAVTGVVSVTSTGPAVAIAKDAVATAVAMDAIDVTGGTTVSVTQNANSVSGTAAANVDNVGDIITQGAVTVIGGAATTSVSVVQSDQVAAVAAQAAAGAFETQVITFKALAAKNSVTVNGLTFTAAVDMTAEEVAQAFAGLTNGDRQDDGGSTAKGIYTGANNTLNFTSGAAVGATVTYTEVTAGTNAGAITVATAQNGGITAPVAPTVAAGVTGVTEVPAVTGVLGVANGLVTINDSAAKTITDITVDGYSAGATLGAGGSLDKLTTLTLKNSGAGAAAVTTASTGALTLNLTDVDAAVNLGNTLTALTINTSGEASTGAISAAGAKTVTINAEAALSGGGTFTAATLFDVNGTAAVNLTGATANGATLKTIDASGNSGGVTAVLGATNSVAFTGGSGKDSLTLATAGIAATANIDMGAGDDTLTLGAGTTAANILGTIKGGDGTDTLALGYADAVAASASGAFHAKVEGFERLTINNLVGANDATDTTYTVNLANLAYNYVTVNGTYSDTDPEVDTLALTGMAANGTVAFGGLSTAGSDYTVALADATGGADVLNYVLASTNETSAAVPPVKDTTLGTANNAGTITANLVETFNITSTAVDLDGATNVITANGDSVKAISLSGNAGVNLTSTATTLKTVDAGGLTGTGAAGGLVFSASNASMTVTGGAGNDQITIAATADGGTFNGGDGNDTFVIAGGADLITLNGGAGNDIFDFNGVSTNKSNFAVISGVNAGDTLDFAGLVDGTPATTFTAARITLSQGATESTQAYLDQAVTTLAENGFGWFQFNGNTYIAGDVGAADSTNAFADGQDFVVMITGLVDLSTASFNAASATLEIA